MKNTLKNSLILCGLLLVASLSFGQATAANLLLTATKLSAAATASTNVFTVASATGITANSTVLFVDDGNGGNGEAVFVNAVSGTQVSITRGYNGTKSSAHLSGSVVLAGPPPAFVSVEPSGSCTAASAYTPTVNILNHGHQWICSSISASWVPGFFNVSRAAGVTTLVASVAGATNPTGPLFHVSGTNAITAWGSSTTAGLGAGGGSATQPYGAPFCVIPDGAFTWTATNNIATAGTAVTNLVICFTFDGTNKKYVQQQSK
jgi:hypothetical protein